MAVSGLVWSESVTKLLQCLFNLVSHEQIIQANQDVSTKVTTIIENTDRLTQKGQAFQ